MTTPTPNVRGRTVRDWQRTFRGIYQRRNLQASSPSRIAMQIGRELRILSKCMDRGKPMSEQALAGLIARLFALANFLDEDLAYLLASKYPEMCPYCKDTTCHCVVAGADKSLSAVTTAMGIADGWAIDDAQRMLARIYGRRNAEAGILPVFHHLTGEYLELCEAVSNLDQPAQREEIADVLAWTLGLVTLSDIPSVSELLYAHYPDACSRCGCATCDLPGPCPPL